MAKEKTKAKAKKPESHEFQAEVSRLLHLMVHSVYSQKEIFLRELISNAADACDKLRYAALSKPKLLGDQPDLKITITLDKKADTLKITDNGIGMNEAELSENLGTIARSGTRAFLEQIEGDKSADISQIGQFGIGFYSAFMVADHIDVFSRHAGNKQSWQWSSDGMGTFTITPLDETDDNSVARGTIVTLKLKKDAHEYFEPTRIETIIRAYSDHVALPIELIEIEDKKPSDARQINSARALWMRPKSDISEDQYKEFFGHIGGMFGEPALTIHYKAEGRHEYSVLLFVPDQKPFDLFDPQREARTKLYVKRVFISDDAVILPPYLRFLRGVVDSEDMPLNISREMLQDNPIVSAIGKAVTNRVLSELEKLSDKKPDIFANIWENFSAVLKEGLYEDIERRDQLLSLARFQTTKGEGLRSLKDYVSDLPENQTSIYYITGDSADQIAASPHLEGFKARDIEVLLLSDPVDHFWTTSVTGFDGKPFKSITQGAADLDNIKKPKADDKNKDEDKVDESALGALISIFKQALGDNIADIRKSDRLTDSAVCLVSVEGGMDKGLEKMLGRDKGADFSASPRVLELNPTHGLITGLVQKATDKGSDKELEDAAWLLFDLAKILDGETVSTPQDFAERLSRIMGQALEG